MATLNSPGVAVTVIDESFYTPAEQGTVPLIIVATAQDKTNGSGTGTALATTKANAGKAFTITSQRDLVDLFGVPFFEKTASGTPVHAGERNEYGLLAAYSFLGVSNAAFIVRADVDLNELEGSATAPGAEPKAGQWWFDTQNTAWGIQEWNGALKSAGGQKFVNKTPIVLEAEDSAKVLSGVPRTSVGVPGDYAVVAQNNSDVGFFYKNYDNVWVLIGSNEWSASHAAVVTKAPATGVTAGDTFAINGYTITVPGGATVGARIQGIVNLITAEVENNPNGPLRGVSARYVAGAMYVYTNGNSSAQGDSSLANAIVITPGTGTVLSETELGVSGTYYGPSLAIAPHTQVPLFKRGDLTTDDTTAVVMTNGRPTGSVWVKTTEPNSGARWRVKRWNSATQVWDVVNAPLYANGQSALYGLDRTGGGLNIPTNSVFVQFNSNEETGYDNTPTAADFKLWRRASTGATVIISSAVTDVTAGSYSFTLAESIKGSATLSSAVTVTFEAAGGSANAATDVRALATAINGSGLANVKADISGENELIVSHATGGEIRIVDTNGIIGTLFADSGNFYNAPSGSGVDFVASNWQALSTATFIASGIAPLNEPQDGQLWYNPEFSEVDILLHNGTTWIGYKSQIDTNDAQQVAAFGTVSGYAQTDPNGPLVAASQPTTQSDGTALVAGDLWISTADTENFPTIYRYNGDTLAWDLVDKTDQTSEDGILFADARAGTTGGTATQAPTGTIKELLTSNFLDPDAPDPALYPKGMLLWNLRRSGGNVKKYNNNYIDTTVNNPRYNPLGTDGDSTENYFADRWTTASANQEDGSGTFGRKAQHAVVVAALKSVVDTSAEIRDEERRNFNLIAAPGYPELLSNLVNLNIDRGITAFVVGDTPFRLASDATSLTNWGTNANGALDNNEDGIVTYDEYCAVFYPQGYTTDLSGTYAVVPSSHMMLKTIALSDQVSYPWFAPAGTRRGGITNATAVGYIDATTGEFQQVSLNEGQRDTLYNVKVNPITFFNGVGLVNYGQKTRGKNASALDRINVSRLTVYLRSQLAKLARPYVFEPNDKITRDEIKAAVESLLLELVSLRAIYDFAVVCDESNNTPARIDRNELYVDVAIEPVKAVEFIYIPLRVKNTGEL